MSDICKNIDKDFVWRLVDAPSDDRNKRAAQSSLRKALETPKLTLATGYCSEAKAEAPCDESATVFGGEAPEPMTRAFRLLLDLWQHRMTDAGRKASYQRRNLQAIHSIYVELTGKKSPDFRSAIADLEANKTRIEPVYDLTLQLRDVIRRAWSHFALSQDKDTDKLYFHIFLVWLFMPNLTLQEVVLLNKEAKGINVPQVDDIIEQWSETKRKFVFPLGHASNRVKRMVKDAQAGIAKVLSDFGWPMTVSITEELISSIWAQAAILNGVSYADVRSYMDTVPAVYKCLELFPKTALPVSECERIGLTAASYFVADHRKWYAMKMHSGSSVDEVTRLLSAHDIFISTYYPLAEIRKRVHNRFKKAYVPFIDKVLFFQANHSWLPRISMALYNHAWVYRKDKRPDSDYAEIHDMHRFQRAIGMLTPDSRIELLDASLFPEGQTVEIIAGAWRGQTATVVKAPSADSSPASSSPSSTKGSATGSAKASAPFPDSGVIISIAGAYFYSSIRIDSSYLKPLPTS